MIPSLQLPSNEENLLTINVLEESKYIATNEILRWGGALLGSSFEKSSSLKPRLLSLIIKQDYPYIYKLKQIDSSFEITRSYSLGEVLIISKVNDSTFSIGLMNTKSYNWQCNNTNDFNSFLNKLYKLFLQFKIKLPRLIGLTEVDLRKMQQDPIPSNTQLTRQATLLKQQTIVLSQLQPQTPSSLHPIIDSDSDSDYDFPKTKVNLLEMSKRPSIKHSNPGRKFEDSDSESDESLPNSPKTPLSPEQQQLAISSKELEFYSKMDQIHLDQLLKDAKQDYSSHPKEYPISLSQDLKIESILRDYLSHLEQRNLAHLVDFDESNNEKVVIVMDEALKNAEGIKYWLNSFVASVKGLQQSELERETLLASIQYENLSKLYNHLMQVLANDLSEKDEELIKNPDLSRMGDTINAAKSLISLLQQWQDMEIEANVQQKQHFIHLSQLFTSKITNIFTTRSEFDDLKELVGCVRDMGGNLIQMAQHYSTIRKVHYTPLLQQIFSTIPEIQTKHVEFSFEKIQVKEKSDSGFKTLNRVVRGARKDIKAGIKEFSNTLTGKDIKIELPKVLLERDYEDDVGCDPDEFFEFLNEVKKWFDFEDEYGRDYFGLIDSEALLELIFEPLSSQLLKKTLQESSKRNDGIYVMAMSKFEQIPQNDSLKPFLGELWNWCSVQFNDWIVKQCNVINDIGSNVDDGVVLEPGLYGFIKHLITFIEFFLSIVSSTSPKTRNLVIQSMENVTRCCLNQLDMLSKKSTMDSIISFIPLIENYHHFHTQLRIFSSFQQFINHSKTQYDLNMNMYSKGLVKKYLFKWYDFIEKVEDVLRSGNGDEVSTLPGLTISNLKEILIKFDSKDMKKIVDNIKHSLDDALKQDVGLKRIILARILENLLKLRKRMVEILKRCYPGLKIDIDWSEDDLKNMFM